MAVRIALVSALCATLSALCATLAALPARADVDLWPLLEIDDDTTTVAYPLFVKDGDFMMVFPLYTRTNGARDHHVLWPLLKTSEGRLTRLAPLYFSAHEDEFTLFPLIRQTPDYVAWSVPPVYADRHEKFWMLFPLYLRDDDLHLAFPNLYFENGPGGSRRFGSVGIFDYAREGDDRTLHAPLWLAGARFGGDTRWSYLAPLYAWREDPEREMLFILTYYRTRSAVRESTGVFPFYAVAEERGSSRRKHSWSVLWPLYERVEVVDEGGALLSRQRRFLLFSDALDEEGNRTLRIIGIPVVERTRS